MATNFRTVTGPHQVSTASSGAEGLADETKQGSWRGTVMKMAPPGSVARAAVEQRQQFGDAFPLVQVRDLASRRVMGEPQFRRMAINDLFQRARTLNVDPQRMRAGARGQLNGSAGSARSGRSSAASRYMSLHLAAASLEDDVGEDAATAMLTHAGEGQHEHTPQELLEKLRSAQAAGDTSDEFQHFLDDVLSGLDITADDAKEYADEMRHARNDDEKLLKLLRSAQKIPELHRDQDRQVRVRLREKIQNEIREFESSSEGRQVLASFNAAPVAAGMAEPGTFLQTYTELVSVPRTFAAALKVLLTRHALDTLDGILDKLKKALGDDLNAATPSHDTRRLGAVLTDLGNMTLSTSLIESVKELTGLMYRIEEKNQGEGGKRGRPGQEEDEDEEEKAGVEEEKGKKR